MRKVIISLAVVLLVSGCIPRPWTPTSSEKAYVATAQNVSVRLPDGWMVRGRKDVLLLTRDGLQLQNVLVETVGVDDELKYTKKKFRRGMSPLEQAEVILDNYASSPNINAFKVLDKKPAEVDGHQAFRAEISYKDEDGLVYKGVMYGFMQNNWFYLVRYVAPKRFYFSRDEGKFEKIVKSLKLMV